MVVLHILGAKILSRSRVNRQLDQIFAYPLTVVRAPMGFGKTTALREYVHAKHLDPIWLSLLGSGGSLAYCWERMNAQIKKKNPQLAQRFMDLGFPKDAPQLAKIVGLVCETEYTEPTLLVIDDYHLIDCQQTADLITLIAGEQVKNLHIVLLTRNTQVLPVADLEQRGLCWVMGQEVLQFRAGEIKDYFALMEYDASEEALQSVGRWTGGWISGIYLVLRGMRQGLPIGRGEDIDQLLELNLYSAYDGETQNFLEKLSWLDAFTPEQVSWVFEDTAASAKLLNLVQGNAFIMYNNTLAAYKMTDLLQEFLQGKARQKGVDPHPLWHRMGLWFLERGKSVLAYDYLCRAGEIETILQDLDRAVGKDIHFAQFPQIHKVFDGLPSETAFRYPLATLRNIRVMALSGPPSSHSVLEEHLQNMERYFLTVKDMDEQRRTLILGEIHNTWIFIAFNDVQQVVAHAEQAVKYFAGRYSCIVSNETEFNYGAPHLLYCYYKKPGTLRDTARFIANHFHTLAQAVEGCGSGSEPLALAEYALETGDFDNVELNAQRAIYQARSYNQTSIEICAAFVLARLSLYRGKFAEGERLIGELAGTVSSQNSAVLNTTMELCAAYISSCFGKVDAIPNWLKENDMDTGSFLFQGVAFPYIVCMRAVLLSGAFIRLEVLCQEFREKFALYNNQLGFIHNYICCAVARSKLYGIEAGCEELEHALVLAAADDVVMPFAENAIGILPMLRKMRCSRRVPQDFLARVVSCCERYQQSVSGLLPTAVTLTDREREILQMLAKGMKHEEIAAGLYISVPTVRYHVKNVYQKLEVNNKVSAIQKARTMNLI